jgi:hypothetical protein
MFDNEINWILAHINIPPRFSNIAYRLCDIRYNHIYVGVDKNMEFSIVTISAFVMILDDAAKRIASCFDLKIDRYVPILSLIFGIVLGVWGYFIPSVNMGNNIVEAIFIGLAAGGCGTGYHQVYKQLTKDKDELTVTSEPVEETKTEEDESTDE